MRITSHGMVGTYSQGNKPSTAASRDAGSIGIGKPGSRWPIWVRDIKVEIPATPLEPPDRSTSGLSAFMNADKNEPDGSFPERTKRKKPRRPRPSAAGKRVSPRDRKSTRLNSSHLG